MKLIAILLLGLILSNCTSLYPTPIIEPKALDSQNVRVKPDYQRGGLLPPTTITEAIENAKIYGDAYQQNSVDLRTKRYIASDAAMLGGIVGVVSGISKSVEGAITGAALASGSSMYSEHYKLEVQASNYSKASAAMYCLYNNLHPVNGGGIQTNFVRERIDEIRRKLLLVQVEVDLASADVSSLETALNEAINKKKSQETLTEEIEDTEKNVSETRERLDQNKRNVSTLSIEKQQESNSLIAQDQALLAQELAALEKLETRLNEEQRAELEAKLNTCVAKF